MGFKKLIEGIITLAPTPFNEQREPNIEGWKENLEYLDEVGMHGVVLGASVGEYYQLTHKEWMEYADAARDVCQNMLFLAGVQFWNTKETVLRAKYARKIGADGIYMLHPYFSSWLSEEECIQHFRAAHDAAEGLQVMIYNTSLSGHIVSIEGWEKLLQLCPRITAVKECTVGIEMGELVRRFGDRINILSGALNALYQCMILGGKGAISTEGAAIPEWALAFYELCKAKKWEEALVYHRALAKHAYDKKYHPDRGLGGNKAITMAAGRHGGPTREPFAKATAKTMEFHRRWLQSIGYESYGFEGKKRKPKPGVPGLEVPKPDWKSPQYAHE